MGRISEHMITQKKWDFMWIWLANQLSTIKLALIDMLGIGWSCMTPQECTAHCINHQISTQKSLKKRDWSQPDLANPAASFIHNPKPSSERPRPCCWSSRYHRSRWESRAPPHACSWYSRALGGNQQGNLGLDYRDYNREQVFFFFWTLEAFQHTVFLPIWAPCCPAAQQGLVPAWVVLKDSKPS